MSIASADHSLEVYCVLKSIVIWPGDFKNHSLTAYIYTNP
jgi:hypothetical protein